MLYHKIDSVFKRDPETKYKTFLDGEWSRPEFGYLAYLDWEGTEKVDGTNVRIHLTEHGCSFGGRTERAELPKQLSEYLSDLSKQALAVLPNSLTLYGEGYGAKIQGGGDYRQDQGFILFDVATEDGMFLQRTDVEDIARQLRIPVTPVVFRGDLHEAIHDVRYGNIRMSRIANRDLEGLVLRPAVELRDRRGERIITKVKVRDFQGGGA